MEVVSTPRNSWFRITEVLTISYARDVQGSSSHAYCKHLIKVWHLIWYFCYFGGQFNGTSVTSCVYCLFYLPCCVKTTLKRLFQTKHPKINIWEGINKTFWGMSSITERSKSSNHKTFFKSLTNGMLELFCNLKTIYEFIFTLNRVHVGWIVFHICNDAICVLDLLLSIKY